MRLPRGPFATIYADPPWPIPPPTSRPQAVQGSHSMANRLSVRVYPIMSLETIKELPVKWLVEEQAHLYLWVTGAANRAGMGRQVAEAWGFRLIGEIIWVKPQIGMGVFPRNQHETLLIGKRGNLLHINRNVSSVQRWPKPHKDGQKWHSAKPPEAYDLIEANSPGPYLELFARSRRRGWSRWGLEA